MSAYPITRACGHVEEINIAGSLKKNQWKIKKAEEEVCDACYLKECEEWATQQGLPPLKGTERQVAWATKLRRQRLPLFEHHAEHVLREQLRDKAREILKWMRQQDSASYWIDTRDNIEKAFRDGYASVVLPDSNDLVKLASPAKETDKAIGIKVAVVCVHTDQVVYRMAWFPKSQLTNGCAPAWMVEKKKNEILDEASSTYPRSALEVQGLEA